MLRARLIFHDIFFYFPEIAEVNYLLLVSQNSAHILEEFGGRLHHYLKATDGKFVTFSNQKKKHMTAKVFGNVRRILIREAANFN